MGVGQNFKRNQEFQCDTQIIDLDGWTVRLAVDAFEAEDSVPLLMINGLGAALEVSDPLVLHLRDTIQTIRFDIPGVNGLAPPKKPYRLSTVASKARRLLDRLDIEQADIMGVSWGGGAAQEFARRYPARCRSLILAGTSMGAVMVPPKLTAVCAMMGPDLKIGKKKLGQRAETIYGGKLSSRKDVLSLCARYLKPNDNGYQLFAMAGWTSVHWAWRLKMPVLVMAGKYDRLVHVCNARIMAHWMPNARLAVFDCGHLFLLTHVEEAAQAIKDFRNKWAE